MIEPQPGAYQNFTWYPFLWQTGADVTDPEMTKATFDSPGTAKALDLWRTLIQKGYAPRTATDITANVDSDSVRQWTGSHASSWNVGDSTTAERGS